MNEYLPKSQSMSHLIFLHSNNVALSKMCYLRLTFLIDILLHNKIH